MSVLTFSALFAFMPSQCDAQLKIIIISQENSLINSDIMYKEF